MFKFSLAKKQTLEPLYLGRIGRKNSKMVESDKSLMKGNFLFLASGTKGSRGQ
jgi:hypothetical protein